ncbi:ABC transporter permease [Roseibium marinum]|uniref:Peptide/nickel transport system permease protein n=1 Tax=Roseibium marinum TaxID=281252 RepID=A0A2S3UKR1_9HYPH|nr:ABC transporter permease [Roseibium marinum]POF28318.1 peptide/nickel transport system permease protein [Roseibium marinum]
MTEFIIGKFIRMFVALLVIVTLTFIVLRTSGDPAQTFLPPDASPKTVEDFREKWGLDRPLPDQYLAYLKNVMGGDLGHSFVDGRPASQVVGERIPKTLLLLGTSFFLMLAMGFPLGIISALKHNTWVDRLVMSIAVFGYSLPNFFLGILLILFFSMYLRWLPSTGSGTWQHLIMPVVTIGTAGAAVIARFVRSAMLEVISKPYVRSAKARGLSRFTVVVRHALPNAAIPTVTVIGFLLGSLIAGAVVTEAVFAWPGIGRLTVTAVASRDLAVVQTIVLLIAVTMVCVNLIVDLLYGWLDPRIRDGLQKGRN